MFGRRVRCDHPCILDLIDPRGQNCFAARSQWARANFVRKSHSHIFVPNIVAQENSSLPTNRRYCDVRHRYHSANNYAGIERSSAVALASRADTAIRRAWRSFAHLLQKSNYPNVTEKKAPPTAASGAVGQTWRPVEPTSRPSAFCHNGKLPDVMAITFYLLMARASEQPFRRARCGIVPTSPPTIEYAMASLVRLASGYHLQPSRTMACSVAPGRRSEMEFGHHQRLGTTLGLSEVQ